jgi:hypothetical protein
MNTIPKPRPIVFMLAGYELAGTLEILEKWETLTNAEVEALGLGSIKRRNDPTDCIDELNVLRPLFGKARRDPL